MTDREMLELAAKAGGYARHEYVENSARDGRVVTGHYDSLLEVCINPLTDDGDALRLAVKLELELYFGDDDGGATACAGYTTAAHADTAEMIAYKIEHVKTDPYAATRRAIVRAAAGMVLDQWSGHGPFDCVKATVPGDGYGVDSPALVSDEEGYTWMSEDSETVADPSNTAAEIGRQMEETSNG